MIGLYFIFLISTIITQQSTGFQNFQNRFLTEPAYQNRRDKIYFPYNQNTYDRSDDSSLEDNENRETYNEEELKDAIEEKDEENSRRLFEWFSRLFHTTTSVPTTVTTTESIYQRELRERIFIRALHQNLTQVLSKLADIEKRVALAMGQKENYAIITKGKPQFIEMDKKFYYSNRLKRDVLNVTKPVTIAIDKTSNITEETTDNISLNATECPCNVTSGRRAGVLIATPTEVKNKLLLYLQETFQEIKNKIISLKNLKQAFADNVSFKIGYILANIDTLEISMLNLKNNMERNKEIWEDRKILELYDTLKVSNQAVSGLIETLKGYLEKLSYQPQQIPDVNLG